jgi:hypothetical protein
MNLLTDQELIDAFTENKNAGRKPYVATFVPKGMTHSDVSHWEDKVFYADSKPEATKIAREYGTRIIGKKMVYVYTFSTRFGKF